MKVMSSTVSAASEMRSRVASRVVPRFKERRQESVHLQVAGPRQLHAIAAERQEPLLRQPLEALAEGLQNINTELALEVSAFQAARFQLQDHLADEAFTRRHRQRPPQWQLALIEHADVRLPGIDVLNVDAIRVAERGDASAEHVGAVPEAVAVDEFDVRSLLQRVGAADPVAGLDHLVEGVTHPRPLG